MEWWQERASNLLLGAEKAAWRKHHLGARRMNAFGRGNRKDKSVETDCTKLLMATCLG